MYDLTCRDTRNPESEDPQSSVWFVSMVPGFKKLPDDELPTGSGIAAGVTYKTFCLSPTRFLQHQLQICKNLGAEVVKAKIESLVEVFELELCHDAVGVVNCTGIGARTLVPDEKISSTKGQTIIVRGKASKIAIRTGGKWENQVVPQPGSNTTLLSGCKLDNDWWV